MPTQSRKVTVGMQVEISQMASLRQPKQVWLPFLVTHVHDENQVSGVAFSGMPGALGWMNRAAQAFDHVEQGDGIREWRMPAPPQAPARTKKSE